MHYSNIINKNYLIACIFSSLILHFISAFFSIGFFSDDEHFQILEISAYLLGLNEIAINDTTGFYWEWQNHIRMRPWLQPLLYYKIINLLKSASIDNPFIWATSLRFISSFLGFVSILYLYFTFKDIFFKKNIIFNTILFFLFWFYPFLHSRTSSENLSITLFIISFCAIFQMINYNDKNFKLIYFIFFSFLMGLSMVVKYTTVFTAFPFFFWIFFFKFNYLRIFLFGTSVLTALSLGLYIDYINWGSFKNTYYQFYIYNLTPGEMGRMKYFGVDPWYYYIIEIIKQLAPVLSIFFLIGLIFFWIKNFKHPLTWITFVTFTIFSLIGHKEIRYIFPIYIFAPLFIAYFLEHINIIKLKRLVQTLIILSNIIFLLITLFFPANSKVGVYNFLHKNYDSNIPIYYIGENPYQVNEMEPFFYTRYLPSIQNYQNKNDNDRKYILVSNNFDKFNNIVNKKCTNIYSTYPLRFINLNSNWKRLKLNWQVFKCSSS